MKNKVLLVVAVMMTSVFASQAQTDKKAQDILAGVSAKYKSLTSVKADFSLTLDNPSEKIKDTQKGVVYLKGNKYRIEIAGQEIVSDGKSVWTYLKDANEVQITEAVVDKDAITPTNIFTAYEKGFKSKFSEEKIVKGVPMQLLELLPEDSKKSYFKVHLTVNKNDKVIDSVKLFDRNGNRYTYSILNFTPNGVTSDDVFVFNKARHPGIEVVDLR